MFTLNCRGRMLTLDQPRIMGVLNLTPDSFSDGGQFNTLHKALKHTEHMLKAGADIIDIGGYSSRPFAEDISPREELARIETITEEILQKFPEAIISIDTFRSQVARKMLEKGVHMINDISSGVLDSEMAATVAEFKVPYVAMHMQGTPQTMQNSPGYGEVVEEVHKFFVEKIQTLQAAGIYDLILDPGLGFGKQILHNYQLLGSIERFLPLGYPVLIGLSRKSMLYKLLNCEPNQTSEAAAALHFQALLSGVHILRVHEVKAASDIIRLFKYMQGNGII